MMRRNYSETVLELMRHSQYTANPLNPQPAKSPTPLAPLIRGESLVRGTLKISRRLKLLVNASLFLVFTIVHWFITYYASRFTHFFLDPDSDMHIIRVTSEGVTQQTFTKHGGDVDAYHACRIYRPETPIRTT